VTLGGVLVAGALGCDAILGLEEINVLANAVEAGSDAATGFCAERPSACGAFCRELLSPADGGALLYCNDFDTLEAGAPGKFGFEGDGIATFPEVAASLETGRVRSAPNAYRIDVTPTTSSVGNVAVTKVLRAPTDLTIRFSVSFDPADPGANNRTIPLVVFPIEGTTGSAIIFGVDEGRYFVSRSKESLRITTSEIKAERVLVPIPLPSPEYATFVLAVDAASECTTPQPDAGVAFGDRAVFVHQAAVTAPFLGPKIACKILPPITPAGETDLAIGGFVKDPVEPLRWRFDDIVVRAK